MFICKYSKVRISMLLNDHANNTQCFYVTDSVLHVISISYSLSRISRALPSSRTFVRSLSLTWSKVFETTPILISMALISFLTEVMDFLMFCKGVLSLNCLPVSSIFLYMLPKRSLISYSSVSRFSTFLLTVVKLVWISRS